ncbi:PDZ/DHR/GLGF domain protein [Ancylostoma ceylanicum]|uniref:PDZ/DHR/GLGF domain protein n=1 Tax=Ancylostoma ceylanicum TaxID=53326 RepID=A0A0D6L716_9BILA|nr:PDZ/DHR/GLGF domain protein [Ancylostoma ceylanicum]
MPGAAAALRRQARRLFRCLAPQPSIELSGDWTQVEVIRLSTEGGGLGFGIVGGTSTGVVVKTILPGSPADRDRRLRPGDHVLQIGNVSTHGMSSQQVATILRQQDSVVEMIVGRPINYADRPPDSSECWTMSTRAALCAASLEEHIQRFTNSSLSAQVTPSTISPSVSQDETKEVVGARTSGGHEISPPSSTAHDRSAAAFADAAAPGEPETSGEPAGHVEGAADADATAAAAASTKAESAASPVASRSGSEKI